MKSFNLSKTNTRNFAEVRSWLEDHIGPQDVRWWVDTYHDEEFNRLNRVTLDLTEEEEPTVIMFAMMWGS